MALIDVDPAVLVLQNAERRIIPKARAAVTAQGRDTRQKMMQRIRGLGLVDSRDYLNSITVQTEHNGTRTKATITTDRPYARRLEFDFVGPDSLGRIFNHVTLPAPHWYPEAEARRPEFYDALRKAVTT